KIDNVKVTKGAEFLGKFKQSEMSDRRYCTKCGGHIMVDHPTLGLIDVRLGALRNFPFKPTVHLNYEETVLPMKDGLPKLKDFPSAFGGSGQALPESPIRREISQQQRSVRFKSSAKASMFRCDPASHSSCLPPSF